MSTGSPADNKKRRTETVVDSPASQTVCHTESEASVTVCQIRERREPELQPEDDWTDAQQREVEMTEPELKQGNDNDEQSDLLELGSELECEYRHPCVAESILTDVTVRVEDRAGMIGGVTIMWIGHEAFVQLASQWGTCDLCYWHAWRIAHDHQRTPPDNALLPLLEP